MIDQRDEAGRGDDFDLADPGGLGPAGGGADERLAGGLAVAATAASAVAVAGEQWKDLVAEAQAERDAVAEAKANMVETISIPKPQ